MKWIAISVIAVLLAFVFFQDELGLSGAPEGTTPDELEAVEH
jgi:hypothetical protein